MALAKLALETNVPAVIALQFADGKPVASTFGGDQVLFTLADGRAWYTSPFVADKLRTAGVAPHKPFEIVKREVGRYQFEYQIRLLAEEKGAAPSWQNQAAPAAPPARTLPTHANDNVQHTAPAALSPRMARYMSAYKDACDILIETREYLNRKGFQREFEFADIRALSATMMIDEQKGGR